MQIPTRELSDGTTIPQLGFGVFQVPPEDTKKVVLQAFEVGYRHIDTAQMYQNEKGVGDAIAESGLSRDEIYVTSKLNNGFHRPQDARRSMDESLERLGLDNVDLFLIHWPLPTRYDGDFVSTWQTMVELQQAGKTTSAGVSNFQPAHLDRIVGETGVAPVINQIEVHPYFANEEARAASARHGALVEAWSPIAQGDVLEDPALVEIAEAVGRSTAQVTLRWHVQRGDIIFPKSVTPKRMEQNFAIFDFELSDAQMSAVDGLDRGEDGRRGPNPDSMDVIPD